MAVIKTSAVMSVFMIGLRVAKLTHGPLSYYACCCAPRT
jgi:hypothetical protein